MNAKEFLKAKGVWERSVELPSGKEIKLAELMEEYAQQPRFPVTKERILKALYESANISMKEDCVDVTVTFAKQADAIMRVLSESSPAGAAAFRPTDEEIEKWVKEHGYYGSCPQEYYEGLEEGAKWVRDSLSHGVEDNQTKKQ